MIQRKKRPIETERFICIDCEATGLNTKRDRIIEVAVALFTFQGVLKDFETLVNPEYTISAESIQVHHITQNMVEGKPLMKEIFPQLESVVQDYPLVGHGILFDISLLQEEAKRCGSYFFHKMPVFIDTLRLARLYGESASNSLEELRKHFNVAENRAHRAMNDVIANIAVFKHLVENYSSTKEVLKKLEKPVELKTMPFGKHKGRLFREIPTPYLSWLLRKNVFDEDLTFTMRNELKKRKQKQRFIDHCNPFANL